MLTQCGCEGTAHDPGCPFNPNKATPLVRDPKPFNPEGWICPRCQQVNAPWKSSCDCPPKLIGANTDDFGT